MKGNYCINTGTSKRKAAKETAQKRNKKKKAHTLAFFFLKIRETETTKGAPSTQDSKLRIPLEREPTAQAKH